MSTVQSFFVDDALRLKPLPSEQVAQTCKKEDAVVWLDLQFTAPQEAETWFAYPAALLAMAVVGVGMYLFFRRTGWFD